MVLLECFTSGVPAFVVDLSLPMTFRHRSVYEFSSASTSSTVCRVSILGTLSVE
jgi:hypothetical protein